MKEKKSINVEIGQNVKRARENAGLTQERFAEMIEEDMQCACHFIGCHTLWSAGGRGRRKGRCLEAPYGTAGAPPGQAVLGGQRNRG